MNKTLWQYYVDKATQITDNALENIDTLEKWEQERPQRKKEFFISMGLDPFPEKCELSIKILGEFKRKGFIARKIAYQILPDCWNSGHLYLPDPLPEKKVPAVLYLCGHARIGTHWYQRHAIMWARRGYACFIVETIRQSGNTGWHHGLYTGTRLDWISRGYTSAGGELLNSIRALDVLCQMPEVDIERIGTTGHSGGGAHSHFLGIADERIKAVASSCGISTLKAAIGSRTMFQHCDCMYANGIYQRDNIDFSALIAPRPLLYCFASGDSLFTPEEYRTLYKKVKKIYKLYGCEEKCELFEYPGPHAYSDSSVKKINDWFDRFVAGEEHPDIGLEDENIPESEMSVFNGKYPEPNRMDLLPEILTVRKTRYLPRNIEDWKVIRSETVTSLIKNVFHWLERCDEKMKIEEIGRWIVGDIFFSRYKAEVADMECYIESYLPKKHSSTTIITLGEYKDDTLLLTEKLKDFCNYSNIILVEPRACGRNASDMKQGNHSLYRAGALVGITPLMMWIKDLEYILEFFRNTPECKDTKFILYGRGEAGGACLYYSIFDENISAVMVENVPDTHLDGCYIPGILKEVDITDASGLIAPRIFGIVLSGFTRWNMHPHWGIMVYERLGITDRYIMGDFLNDVMKKIISKVLEK